MGRQRQLTVYDNIEVASGVRDGDSSAEQQDVVAVDPVYKLTRDYSPMHTTIVQMTSLCRKSLLTSLCIKPVIVGIR